MHGVIAQVKGRPGVVLMDLPVFGPATRLVWHKRRWRCADPDCAKSSCTEEDLRIAAPRMVITDRAGRCVIRRVGRSRAAWPESAGSPIQNALLCEEPDQKTKKAVDVGPSELVATRRAGHSQPNLMIYSLKSCS